VDCGARHSPTLGYGLLLEVRSLMNELNLVKLKQELMEYGLKVGDVGTIVHCMRENAILRWSLSGRELRAIRKYPGTLVTSL
jgi:hypothetical protein